MMPRSIVHLAFLSLAAGLPAGSLAAAPAKPAAGSPLITSTAKTRLAEMDVPLLDAKELYLVVSSGEEISCDWADWIEPELVMADGTRIDLTTLPWKSATASFGRPQAGKSAGNDPLQVGGRVFEKGIGTHADSTIAYVLPAGVRRFQAKVAIDEGGMVRGGLPAAPP